MSIIKWYSVMEILCKSGYEIEYSFIPNKMIIVGWIFNNKFYSNCLKFDILEYDDEKIADLIIHMINRSDDEELKNNSRIISQKEIYLHNRIKDDYTGLLNDGDINISLFSGEFYLKGLGVKNISDISIEVDENIIIIDNDTGKRFIVDKDQ